MDCEAQVQEMEKLTAGIVEAERMLKSLGFEDVELSEPEQVVDNPQSVTLKAQETSTTESYTEYHTTDGLTKSGGVNYNANGNKETYYNLDMSNVVANAQAQGIEGEYWVRDDGVKMYGDKVIVAANLDVYPRGTTVETSLGKGIVLDTGEFASENPTQFDIATSW
jgi:hypothetical protein